MKVAILTFQDTTNYGALLQAFAMQKTIQKYDIECDIVDYKCKNIEKRELPGSVFAYGLLHLPAAIVNHVIQTKKYKRMKAFKELNCSITSENYDKSTIGKIDNKYDKFVSGSDIIWEMNVTGADTTYFLDFVSDDSKKYSLSSSFGYSEIPDEYIDVCKEFLLKYNSISVREDSGASIIKNLIGKEVTVTLDPTLLLKAEEWEKYEETVNTKSKYVLVYFNDKDNRILNYALQKSQEINAKVIMISEKVRNIQGVIIKRAVTVGQFLWLIHNAECVVTASFHGVAYSINYNTPFYYYNRAHQGRIQSLVKKLGLENRDLTVNNDSSIDWSVVNKKIEELRAESVNYIESMIVD